MLFGELACVETVTVPEDAIVSRTGMIVEDPVHA
jgi:hypothetical protein